MRKLYAEASCLQQTFRNAHLHIIGVLAVVFWGRYQALLQGPIH